MTSPAVTAPAPAEADAPRLTTGDLASVKAADFAATLRGFLGDEPRLKRFARINVAVRPDRAPYVDDQGCRSWWAW